LLGDDGNVVASIEEYPVRDMEFSNALSKMLGRDGVGS
jgi:hypothetical protein